jgi:hypothetical protein
MKGRGGEEMHTRRYIAATVLVSIACQERKRGFAYGFGYTLE